MAYQDFMVGDLYVRAELIGPPEEMVGVGPILTVMVVISTKELLDLGRGMKSTSETNFSGDVTKDLKRVAYDVLEELCEVRRDPVSARRKIEQDRSDAIKRHGEFPPEKGFLSADQYFTKLDEWQELLGTALDEGCLEMDIERSAKLGPLPEPPSLSGLEMSNGRWRPENAKLSEILPAEAIEALIPIMNRVQQGDLDLFIGRREIYSVIELHRKRLDEIQIDLPGFAFLLAYFAKNSTGGRPLEDVTLKELDAPKDGGATLGVDVHVTPFVVPSDTPRGTLLEALDDLSKKHPGTLLRQAQSPKQAPKTVEQVKALLEKDLASPGFPQQMRDMMLRKEAWVWLYNDAGKAVVGILIEGGGVWVSLREP